MKKSFVFNWLMFTALFISLLLFVSACGEADHQSSDTGSIAFSVEWIGATTIKDASDPSVTRTLDCDAEGVSTVEATIYDSSGNSVASGGPWNCYAHAGTIENVPEGTNYTVEMRGKNSSGDIIYQGEKTGITVTAGETTNAGTIVVEFTYIPTSVSATAGDGQVTLSWDSIPGATSYNIYWAYYLGVSKTYNEGVISSATTTYTHTSLTNDTTYYYVVTTVHSGGESDESSEVSATPSAVGTTPSAPTNVIATTGDEQVTISWDSVSGATSYNIYWATWSGVSKTDYEGKIADISTTSYTHTGLTNGTSYHYVVTAKNDYGESNESEEVYATPSAVGTTPSAPTNVIATTGDEQVTISWDSVSGATSYNIYWATWSGVSKTDYEGKIADISTTSYTHTGLTNGTSYHYVVTAENDYGESDESDERNVTPVEGFTSLLSETGTITHDGEKHYYEVSVSSGMNLFVTLELADTDQNFYLYVKYGSLPTTSDYDANSDTGNDEAIHITSTQSGTYYIMVYASYYYSYYSGEYTITASTSL